MYLLCYGRVILKTWPKKNQISSEDTTAIIREISKDLKSWFDQNFLVLKATGMEESW
jgi:hypothetical protein